MCSGRPGALSNAMPIVLFFLVWLMLVVVLL